MSLQLGQHTSVRSPRSPRAQKSEEVHVSFALDPHVQKKIAPLIDRIRDLALRRGDGALRDVGFLLGVGRGAANRSNRRPYSSAEIIKMNPDYFKTAISQFGIVLTTADVDMLLLAFKDNIGYLVVSHFIHHLKDTMNASRVAVVAQAFKTLPQDAQGLVEVGALVAQYHPEAHPLVVRGQSTRQIIGQQFVEAFDPAANKAPNGKVSEEEFASYYAGISYGIQADAEFIEMIWGLWDLYEKPPPPPEERCFVPSANSPSGERWTTTTNHSQPRKEAGSYTIVGYTGHVPGAIEHYGESFAATQAHVGSISLSNQKQRYVPLAGEHIDDPLKLRAANKANKHNFAF
eukprot:GILI01014653.1.p1 GENE.GILI01014653.1~~GILI01014653.1.p1  ORF type:complete len:346 (+),score=67.82 GILI01014653.1:55-1092(+)